MNSLPSSRVEATPLSGPEEILSQALDEHRGRLVQLVQLRMGQEYKRRIDPQDVLQQAFLDAKARWKHYQGRNSRQLYVWLRLVVLQTLAEIQRNNSAIEKRSVRKEEYGEASLQMAADEFPGSWTSPSSAVARKESQGALQNALRKIAPLERKVLALRHLEGKKNKDTAAILGISEQQASRIYFKALGHIREVLASGKP
ncbi:MAG: sigma-70 family RNA polymerase sigma factor [Gemmataceae bacterium]|nr:sigma-70 family RNA polymerase sigma factor [Gemmataceae bacterium]